MFNEIISHIHPIVVHFPIAMITIALIFDVILAVRNKSISPKNGIWLWIIAAASALLSVATGPEDEARGNTGYMDQHESLASLTAWAAVIVVAARLWMIWKGNRPFVKGFLAGYLILSLLSCGLVLGTGYYGGKMVYSDGVGVKVNGNPVNPPKSNHRTRD